MPETQSLETVIDQSAIVSLASARKRWNRETARAVIASWRESGATARAFCTVHGFPVKRLESWVTRLRREERSSAKKSSGAEVLFAPVKLVDAPVMVDAEGEVAGGACERIEVIFPTGVRLSLPGQFETESVRRLAEVFGC